jgi:uncharacterized lipoprotein YddW (UPF0748 family)
MKHLLQLSNSIFNTCADALVRFSQKSGRQAWLIFLVAFGFSLTWLEPAISYPAQSFQPSKEIRGVWLTNIDSEVLFQRPSVSKAIATLADLKFNTLYPTVWNWGYTLYPSPVAKKVTGRAIDPTEKLQGRDMLKEVVQQGHRQGMKVIPWFEFGFMAPADSPLAKRHPQWLTQRQDGSTLWLEGNVHQRVWLNPLRPDVQKFITDLIVELVSKYDVDGIQIDDHFGFPSDFGYDNYTVKLYQQEHDGQSPPTDYKNPEWIRWRADKITAYMQQLFQKIKEKNPQAIVSLSPNPQGFSLESFLLDWQTWERMGLIEQMALQVYRNNLDSFLGELSQPEVQTAKEHIPFAIGILAGLKGRPVSLELIEKQVKATREGGFAGVSFFFYESLWNFGPESPSQRQAFLRTLFSS